MSANAGAGARVCVCVCVCVCARAGTDAAGPSECACARGRACDSVRDHLQPGGDTLAPSPPRPLWFLLPWGGKESLVPNFGGPVEPSGDELTLPGGQCVLSPPWSQPLGFLGVQ